MNTKFLYAICISLFAIGIVSASPTISGPGITPNSTYEFVPVTFHVTVSDTNTLTSIAWTYNGISVYTENVVANSVKSGTFNYTAPAYNAIGGIIVTANVLDSANTFSLTSANVLYKTYVLPSITSMYPSVVEANTLSTFEATVAPGSYPVGNIIWGFQSNYYTNAAYNGSNYQSYNFRSAGFYTVSAEICDVNNFCSTDNLGVHTGSTVPQSYWVISNASVLGTEIGKYQGVPIFGLEPPDYGTIYLKFRPQNDTNPIQSVTINWGDNTPYAQTTYSNGVLSQTYYHSYGQYGNYTVSVTTCDTVGNCNSTVLAHILYQETFGSALSNVLFNSHPGNSTISLLSELGTGVANFGENLVGALVEIAAGVLLVGALIAVGFFVVVGQLKRMKLI